MTVETALSPAARRHLAAALASLAQWREFASHAQGGLAAIAEKRAAASRELLRAQDAREEVQAAANQPRAALARALGQAAGPTVAEMERAVSVARAAYDELAAEHDLVRREVDRIDGPSGAVDRATNQVREAIGEVLRTEGVVDALVNRFNDILTDANSVLAAMRAIYFAFPRGRTLPMSPLPEQLWQDDTPHSAPLKAAILALQLDATAEIPTLPGVDLKPQPEAAAA